MNALFRNPSVCKPLRYLTVAVLKPVLDRLLNSDMRDFASLLDKRADPAVTGSGLLPDPLFVDSTSPSPLLSLSFADNRNLSHW